MSQAIETKYAGPTNYRGSRIIAECAAGRLIWDWDYNLSDEQNHIGAAKQLLQKLNWSASVSSGSLKRGSYVHVLKFTKRGSI